MAPTTTTTTAPTQPGSEVKLPLPKLADMLVDHAHGRVYFTGGEGTDRIVVT